MLFMLHLQKLHEVFDFIVISSFYFHQSFFLILKKNYCWLYCSNCTHIVHTGSTYDVHTATMHHTYTEYIKMCLFLNDKICFICVQNKYGQCTTIYNIRDTLIFLNLKAKITFPLIVYCFIGCILSNIVSCCLSVATTGPLLLLGPFYWAIAVPSVTCCRCRCRHRCRGHRTPPAL